MTDDRTPDQTHDDQPASPSEDMSETPRGGRRRLFGRFRRSPADPAPAQPVEEGFEDAPASAAEAAADAESLERPTAPTPALPRKREAEHISDAPPGLTPPRPIVRSAIEEGPVRPGLPPNVSSPDDIEPTPPEAPAPAALSAAIPSPLEGEREGGGSQPGDFPGAPPPPPQDDGDQTPSDITLAPAEADADTGDQPNDTTDITLPRSLDEETEEAGHLPAFEEEPAFDLGPSIAPGLPVQRRSAGISAHLVVLTGLATVVILAFLLIEPSPRWVLLLGAASMVIGLDGTLRQTWRQPFASGAETSAFLFVPALYMLAVPVVIEHNVPGELAVVVGLIAGVGFGALAWGEVASVRALAPEYDLGRLMVTAGTYVAGFSVFSLTYVFDISLVTAVLAVALASTMLAVEVLREGEIDPMETLGFAVVTGVIMAQARLLMYYVPLDTYLAGLTLLLGFYLVTGLLHSHITRAFSWPLSAEYGSIAAAGLGLVVVARAAGLA